MIITKSELAEELHVSPSRITQYARRGMPIRADGRCDLERCCRWVVKNIDPLNEGYGSAGSIARSHASEWVWLLERRAKREAS
jgi:phage terminase Nu1 subunit (DNA packaging protein)